MRDDDTSDDRYPAGSVPGRSADAPSSGPDSGTAGPVLTPTPRPSPRPQLRDRLLGRPLLRPSVFRRLGELTGRGLDGSPRFGALPDRARRPGWWPAAGTPGRSRLVVATGVVCCLGVAAVAQAHSGAAEPESGAEPAVASSELPERAGPERASRDSTRGPATAAPAAEPTGSGTGSATPAAADPDTATRAASPTPRATPVDPGPVAGLTHAQMNNAKAIVRTGRDLGAPRRALVIAVATAMQESNLYNVASGVLPESQNYPHEGIGWDHDSVGLFQQRSSSGWGPVGRLMDPAYATMRFLSALEQVPGWERMRLTEAAQAVQVSAYPEHYAKHEGRAAEVVTAIVPGWK